MSHFNSSTKPHPDTSLECEEAEEASPAVALSESFTIHLGRLLYYETVIIFDHFSFKFPLSSGSNLPEFSFCSLSNFLRGLNQLSCCSFLKRMRKHYEPSNKALSSGNVLIFEVEVKSVMLSKVTLSRAPRFGGLSERIELTFSMILRGFRLTLFVSAPDMSEARYAVECRSCDFPFLQRFRMLH